jgi:hypothetical protein
VEQGGESTRHREARSRGGSDRRGERSNAQPHGMGAAETERETEIGRQARQQVQSSLL